MRSIYMKLSAHRLSSRPETSGFWATQPAEDPRGCATHPICVRRSHLCASKTARMLESLPAPVYEIRVRGVLGGALLGAFPTLSGVSRGGDTILTGEVPDQAALHGVLSQIESLGLELIALHQVSLR